METADGETWRWSEANSATFLALGDVAVPWREEIGEVILRLVPAEPEEPFPTVEIGSGNGWLSEAVLRRFPLAQVLALDGSAAMRQATAERLAPYPNRWVTEPFDLFEPDWPDNLPPSRLITSSLVIHHLDGPSKFRLYRALFDRLLPGGALLIADLIAPAGEEEQRYLAWAYDDAMRRAAVDRTGSLDLYRRLEDEEWNYFRYPDPVDMPSTIPEHLTWLRAAGFTAVDVFWLRAGHAVYGGFHPS